jgi:TRAP transporter TAXI family solute receptor
MRKHFKFLSVLVVIALVFTVAVGCSSNNTAANQGKTENPSNSQNEQSSNQGSSQPETKNVILTTAGTGGAFYPIGAAMSKIINDNEPTLKVTSQASGGSIENIRLMENKEVEFALLGGDSAVQGFKGLGKFEGKPQNFSGLFSMYTQPLSLVVPADSSIKSFSDLAGKKVAVGAPGSGSEVKSKAVLEALGIPYDKIKPQFISFSEAVDGMKDGNIDVGMIWAGLPVPAIMDLSTVKEIRLIPFTEEEIKTINEAYPYIYKATIPAGTYKGVDVDVLGLAVNTQAVVRNDVDEETVYKFVKTLFENVDDLHAAHKAAKEITAKTAVHDVIPLHPGAEKYFKEIGVLN